MDSQKFELSPILIGSTLSQNATSIYDVDNQSMYSIDGLRFELSINPDDFEAVSLALDTFGNPEFFSGSNRVGTYRFFWTWREDGFTVALGFGLNGAGKCNLGKGFLDFNPNKVPADFIRGLYRRIEVYANSRLVRWDLAIDFMVERDSVRLIKDGRNYECIISSSITEYLGQRSHSGRVKVYDKAAESELDFPCTRVELTCDGSWTVDKIVSQLPTVYYLDSGFSSLSGVTRAFALAVQALSSSGDVFEPWLRLVSSKTKTKIRSVLSQNVALHFSDSCISRVVSHLVDYSL